MRTVILLPALTASVAVALAPAGSKYRAPILDDGPECKARQYNGPLVTNPDTPGAFKAYAPFSSASTVWAADHNLPDDYVTVPGFVNLNAAAQNPGYLSSIEPASYDPVECALYCDNEPACVSFNICTPKRHTSPLCSALLTSPLVYERVPLIINPKTLIPDPDVCPGLATSPSATLIKCAFYSAPLTKSSATNNGQFLGEFEVAFAGSTAFFKWHPPLVDGFYGPFPLNGATIHAPSGYLRMETFDNSDWEPEKCALSCDKQYSTVDGKVKDQCIFFNAYMLYKNGDEGVFSCAYYSEIWGPEEATNYGQVDGSGNVFSVGLSYAYYLQEEHYLDGSFGPDEDKE